jgi:hypothetical protein
MGQMESGHQIRCTPMACRGVYLKALPSLDLIQQLGTASFGLHLHERNVVRMVRFLNFTLLRSLRS